MVSRHWHFNTLSTTATVLTFLTATVQFKGKADHSHQTKRDKPNQKRLAEKEWIKDVILLPSPKAKTVRRNLLRETLFDEGFVISEFKLKSSASEKELTSSIEKALSDKMAFISGSPKFNFVRAVEKKIVEIRNSPRRSLENC